LNGGWANEQRSRGESKGDTGGKKYMKMEREGEKSDAPHKLRWGRDIQTKRKEGGKSPSSEVRTRGEGIWEKLEGKKGFDAPEGGKMF